MSTITVLIVRNVERSGTCKMAAEIDGSDFAYIVVNARFGVGNAHARVRETNSGLARTKRVGPQ